MKTTELKSLVRECFREIKEELGSSSTGLIDGQSNQVAASRVNKILSTVSKGIFSDQSWEAINNIFKKLKEAGLEVELLNAKYGGHADTQTGMPSYKEWQISIPFTNNKGKPMELVGQITAHGAGTVEDPLSRYDITAYVTPVAKRMEESDQTDIPKIPDDAPYGVIDLQNKKIVYKTTYANRNRARRFADKADLKYGAHRFQAMRLRDEMMEEWEPYDAETDTFASGPRDRMDNEENDLQIPEYPKSIIKQHNMDGQQRWFVYSSPDLQALIIGWGKSASDAISNAKTTAKYIKQGGVGHVGELKEGDWPMPPINKEWDILRWAKKRLERESNRLNRDTLERLIQMLGDELKSVGMGELK